MQTYIENVLTVVRNISGIDEAVYSNIYDIELTDKTVFVIIPGDITDNFTAYLVNGSILLMSKVMLVLKSKYIDTNMVITSKDNIKEFSLDNCSGVYNVIKFKLIYRREDCGDSYEGMFVKSINGLHGEVFLDIPEKVSDLVQDVNYITEEDADEKYMQKGDVPTDVYTKSEIDGKFVDSSKYTDDTYAKKSSLDNFYTKSDIDSKVSSIDSSISDVSSRLKTVKDTVDGLDNVYVKSETYNIDKNAQAEVNQDVTTKLGKINTSIGTLNSSVNAIENAGYATETWVSEQGYLNAADKTELEGLINGKQDAGDYATNTRVNEVEGKIPDLTGYATETWVSGQGYLDADDKAEIEGQISSKQDAGDYATNARVNEVEGKIPEVKDFVTNSSISTNYYNKTEIDNKGYLNKTTADTYYQEKGNYVNETVYSNKVSEIDSSISDVSARLKTANDNIANKADLSELANYYTTAQGTALEGRVSSAELNITGLQEDIQTLEGNIPTDYVSNSSISTNYYMKKDVYNKEETDGFIGGLRTEISNTYELKGHYDSAISTLNDSVNTLETNILTKQDKLVSGTNIKTINGNSILGEGNIEIQGGSGEEHVSLTYAEWEALSYDEQMADKVYLIKDAENVYQAPLVSGTNIKTINGNSILGEGNIEIQGGSGGGTSEHQNITQAEYDALTPEQKQADIVYFITDAENEYARASDVQTVSNKVSNIEADYVKHEELPIVPDYTDKFNDIDSSISDVSVRINTIEDNYLIDLDKFELEGKISTVDSNYKAADEALDNKIGANTEEINNVSGRVSTIEADYVKSADIKDFITEKDLPDYNPKFTEINSSISDVSGRVKTIEDDYVKYNDIKDFITLELLPDYNPKFTEINSSISDVSNRVKNIENDYLTSKDKITDYVKLSDYNTKVSEINSSIYDVSARIKNIEDVGLPTRMAVDMSNINAAGELKVKDIIRTEGYITEIPDSYATKNELNSSIANVSSWVSNNYAKKSSLDSYLLKTDAQNTYATTEQVSGLNDIVNELDLYIIEVYTYYNPKLTEINSSISDVSSRLAGIVIPTDYVHTDTYEANLQEQENVNTNVSQKLETIDSSVNNLDNSVSLHSLAIQGIKDNINVINSSIDDLGGRIDTLENANYATEDYVNGLISDLHISDYLKSSDATNTYLKIENLPDYSSKFNEIDSSISNVSTRVKTVENKFDDYVLSSYIEGRISDISSAISSGDYDTLTNANKYTDDEIKKLPNYSVKFTEIDSSISDVSTKVNNSLSLISDLNTRVTNNSLKNVDQDSSIRTINSSVNAIESANYATLTWVSEQGYLNADDKTELETAISSKQDAGDYALKSEIPDVTGFATKTEVSAKQDTLVSGTNIKTINNESILGNGNILIKSGDSTGLNYYSELYDVHIITGKDAFEFESQEAYWLFFSYDEGFQNYVGLSRSRLEINYDGQIAIFSTDGIGTSDSFIDINNIATKEEVSEKQSMLMSGTNIKTINNESILGSGNIDIQSGLEYLTPGTIVKIEAGEYPGSETTLGDYINSKIDEKLGAINTILESI